MNTYLYYLIPLITGIICWILGYLIGRLNPAISEENTHASLKADLSACRANSKNLSDRVAELEHRIYELNHPHQTDAPMMTGGSPITNSETESFSRAASAETSAFDAKKASEILGKKVKVDDLKLVEGIGPKIEEHFHAAGIKTWLDLSNASVDDCQKILSGAGDRYTMHNPGTWPRQAKLMVDGKWEELKAWTDSLDGGKE